MDWLLVTGAAIGLLQAKGSQFTWTGWTLVD
jgi:hypothetical protein